MIRRSKNTPTNKDLFQCVTSIEMNYYIRWVIILSLVFGFMSSTNYCGNVIIVVEASRAYPKGCSNQLPSYYDYDNYPFPPPGLSRTPKDFLLLRRLGAGKFSDVFEAVDVQLEKNIVMNDNNNNNKDQTDNVDSRTLCVLKVRTLSSRIMGSLFKFPSLSYHITYYYFFFPNIFTHLFFGSLY